MSMTLEDHVLGKRKSIDPRDQFSAEGEANLVGKEEAILCEKKDATVDEKEEEDLEDEAYWQAKEDEEDEFEEAANEFWRLAVERNSEIPEDASSILETNFRGLLCPICASPDHLNCPWARGTWSETVPVVNPRFQITCKRCCNTEFEKCGSNKHLTCTKCDSDTLCAVRKFCRWCLKSGHTFNKDNPCKFPQATTLMSCHMVNKDNP